MLVDSKLYWVTCKNLKEANYLLAIINSDALYEAAQPLMSKGQFGSRDLHKHLWKLPIPEFDPKQKLHVAIAKAGERAAAGGRRRSWPKCGRNGATDSGNPSPAGTALLAAVIAGGEGSRGGGSGSCWG